MLLLNKIDHITQKNIKTSFCFRNRIRIVYSLETRTNMKIGKTKNIFHILFVVTIIINRRNTIRRRKLFNLIGNKPIKSLKPRILSHQSIIWEFFSRRLISLTKFKIFCRKTHNRFFDNRLSFRASCSGLNALTICTIVLAIL